MNQEISTLIGLLKHGKKNAQKAIHLEQLLNINSKFPTQEKTRDLIREAIIQHNIPIGSCTKGYFLIGNQKELLEVVDSLDNRILGIKNRRNSLVTGFGSASNKISSAGTP